MTYCVGVLVQDGLLMVADTRTNAGLDNIATFRKLHLFEQPGQKMIALATAGNLGVTQAVISLLREGFRNPDTDVVETLLDQPSMFRAAQFVGHAIRAVGATDGAALERSGASFDVTMLLGGQFGDCAAFVGCGREDQLVVVAAGELCLACEGGIDAAGQAGKLCGEDCGGDAGTFGDVAKVG